MGLDMYLNKTRYVWRDEQARVQIYGVSGITPGKIKRITEEAVYWRKANAIHKWFVDNVQNGEDDCGTYTVAKEQFVKLLATITEVLDDNQKASELLPFQEGFFFGSYDYGEYYWDELKRTKAVLEEIIQNWNYDWNYTYESSW